MPNPNASPQYATRPNPRQLSPASPDSPTYTSFPISRKSSRSRSRTPEPLLRSIQKSPPPPPPQPLPPIPTSSSTSITKHSRNTSTTTGASSSRTRANNTRAPEQIINAVRDHRSYQRSQCRLRERPSAPLLSTTSTDENKQSMRSRSGSTKSAPVGPCISIITGKGSNLHSMAAASAPHVPTLPTRYGRIPSPAGCLPGIKLEDWAVFSENNTVPRGGGRAEHERPRWDIPEGCLGPGDDEDIGYGRRKAVAHNNGRLGEMRQKFKHMWKGLHVSVSISFKEREQEVEEVLPRPRQTKRHMTLRIKNNKTGSCVFEIIKHEDTGDEILTPIDDLKSLFPYSKNIQRCLTEWNRHYQNPPQHWVMNFIPRAYLKRGYTLSEDVCEYFSAHSDGCSYRIEYEPIGHHFCHVGTTTPRSQRRKSRRGGDMWWEGGKEKYLSFAR